MEEVIERYLLSDQRICDLTQYLLGIFGPLYQSFLPSVSITFCANPPTVCSPHRISSPPRTVSSQASIWLFVLRGNHHVGNQATCRVATYYYIYQVCMCVCMCVSALRVAVIIQGKQRPLLLYETFWHMGGDPRWLHVGLLYDFTRTRTHTHMHTHWKSHFSPPNTAGSIYSDAHIPTHLHHAALLYKT